MNSMKKPYVEKVTINIGIGEPGDKLDRAFMLLEKISDQQPLKTRSYKRIPTFNIRPRTICGVKVTLRKEKAISFLKNALDAIDHKVSKKHFDSRGNFSFGIKESIDLPGLKYDPKIGVFGMDVCVTISRPGYRINKRRMMKRSVSKSHILTKDESIAFLKDKFNLEVE